MVEGMVHPHLGKPETLEEGACVPIFGRVHAALRILRVTGSDKIDTVPESTYRRYLMALNESQVRSLSGLTSEQARLLERTYTRFHRAGAGLDEAAKARMAEINERLAHLGTSFSHHLLGD